MTRQPVRSAILWAQMFAAGTLLAACGDDSHGINPGDLDDLTDTWNATKIEYASTETADRVNLVTLGGGGTLVLNDDRTFTLETTSPSGPGLSLAGTWQFNGDIFLLIPSAGGTVSFDLTLNQDVLWLSGADAAYDFDGDDALDPAILNFEFDRAEP